MSLHDKLRWIFRRKRMVPEPVHPPEAPAPPPPPPPAPRLIFLGTELRAADDTKASPSARVAAASALLDRGWGEPLSSVRLDVQD